jgi:hypothetical protein
MRTERALFTVTMLRTGWHGFSERTIDGRYVREAVCGLGEMR